jgi:outer membrane lipase/esterase
MMNRYPIVSSGSIQRLLERMCPRISACSAALILFLALATHAFGQSPEKEMSDTIEALCPRLAQLNAAGQLSAAQRDVFSRCSEVKINTATGQTFDDLSSAQIKGINHMTSTQTSAIKTNTVDIARPQANAITSRLAALRAGSVGGLALNLNDRPADPVYYAGPVTGLSEGDSETEAVDGSGRFGAFINGLYGTGEKDSTGNEPGFEYDNYGVIAGVDYRLTDQFIMGLALGYASTTSDLSNDAGEVDADGYGVSLYGTYYLDQFYLNGIATYGVKQYDSTRNVSYAVPSDRNDPQSPLTVVDQSFKGDSDAYEYGFSLGIGYDWPRGGWSFGPYARVNYFKTEVDGYTEELDQANTNAGFGLGLRIDDQTIESLASTLGARASYAINSNVGVWSPYVRFDWQHEFANDVASLSGSFINGTNDAVALAANTIVIPLDDPDRDFYNLALGLSAQFARGLSAFLDYATVLDLENITAHQFSGGLRFEF